MYPSKQELLEVFYYCEGDLVRKCGGRGVRAGEPAGTLTGDGYLQSRVNGVKFYNHVIVWIMHNGDVPEGKEVDHKDGDRANNRIENLRLADQSQQAWNRAHKATPNWNTDVKKWRVRVCHRGDRIDLGHFADKFEALAALRSAQLLLRGEFA